MNWVIPKVGDSEAKQTGLFGNFTISLFFLPEQGISSPFTLLKSCSAEILHT
jgi:hypothetical protein